MIKYWKTVNTAATTSRMTIPANMSLTIVTSFFGVSGEAGFFQGLQVFAARCQGGRPSNIASVLTASDRPLQLHAAAVENVLPFLLKAPGGDRGLCFYLLSEKGDLVLRQQGPVLL